MLQPLHLTTLAGYVCVLQLHKMVHTASRQLLAKCIVVLGENTDNVCLSFLTNSFQDHSVAFRLLNFANRNVLWHHIL